MVYGALVRLADSPEEVGKDLFGEVGLCDAKMNVALLACEVDTLVEEAVGHMLRGRAVRGVERKFSRTMRKELDGEDSGAGP